MSKYPLSRRNILKSTGLTAVGGSTIGRVSSGDDSGTDTAKMDDTVPGDSFDTAPVIQEGRYDARIETGDTDYWAIDLNEGDILDVEVHFEVESSREDDLNVRLFDPNEATIETFGSDIDEGLQIAETATQTGVHYI